MSNIKRTRKEATRRYYEMYNKEVKDFFQIGQYEDYSIRPSRIHYKSQVRYVERLDDPNVLYNQSDEENNDDDENNESVEEIVGTLWTGQEKRTFFRLLSRYSIHRVTEWGQAIPEKSLYEIMEYYNILNENLNQLRKLKFKGLLKVADMDIAYDMDDQFVEMEEYMSQKLLYKQPYKRKMKVKETNGKADDNNDNDGNKDPDTNDNEPIVKKEEPKNQELPPPDVSSGYDSELIDLDNWERRWNTIYCKTFIEELRTVQKDFIPLGVSSIIYIEQLVKQYLRRLLWYTVLPEIENKKISKKAVQSLLELSNEVNDQEPKRRKRVTRNKETPEPEEDEEKKRYSYKDDEVVDVYSNHKKKKKHKKQKKDPLKPEDCFFPTVITGSEVEKAITMMKNEKNGRFVQTLGESVIDTINKYKIDYKPRDGNIFRKSSVRDSIIPEMIHQTASIYSTDKIQFGTPMPDNIIIDGDSINDSKNSSSQIIIQDPWELKYDLQYKIPSATKEARDDALDLATDTDDIKRSSQICQTIYSYILEQNK